MVVLLLLTGLFAGRTGKVTGKITEADGRPSLVGVNALLDGTPLGATTDQDGYFVILNVPPATYVMVAGMIGFAEVTVTQVVVSIDLSSEVNIAMQPEVLGLEEVTVALFDQHHLPGQAFRWGLQAVDIDPGGNIAASAIPAVPDHLVAPRFYSRS